MSVGVNRCPKCSGDMVQGFIFESEGPRRVVSAWVEGAPEMSSRHGTNVPADKCVPVGSFRCSACGFLELYARPEFAAG